MEKKESRTLMPARIKVQDYAITTYVATAEQGTVKEDFLRPEYWAHIAAKFKPWDQIKVLSDDGTFYGEYMVMSCGRAWAKVYELRFVNLTSSDVSLTQAATQESSGFIVKWRGHHLKWSVIREKDKEPIKDMMATEQEARVWLDEHLKTVA